jgi:hypothetical protein
MYRLELIKTRKTKEIFTFSILLLKWDLKYKWASILKTIFGDPMTNKTLMSENKTPLANGVVHTGAHDHSCCVQR